MTIFNSTDPSDFTMYEFVSPGTTSHTFNGVLKRRTYNVTVVAMNGVGNSSSAGTVIGKLHNVLTIFFFFKLC